MTNTEKAELGELAAQLDVVMYRLAKIEEAHAHVAIGQIGLYSVAHYQLNQAMDLLQSVLAYMTDEIQNGEPTPTHTVWYHSAGCLPDGDGPEFSGTLEECEAWMAAHADEYDTSVLYKLYIEPVEDEIVVPEPGAVEQDATGRAELLAVSMAGFTGLTLPTQGLLTGWSLATGEVWCTTDRSQTTTLAKAITAEYAAGVEAWGVEA